jgi:hypothetical protein
VTISGHVRRQRTGVQDPGHAQRPAEGPAPLRLGEAGRFNVQVRTPPGKAVPRIRHEASNPALNHRDDA